MIAYLILAHDKPRHLAKLIEALASPVSHCFVHIDAKSDITQFAAAKAAGATFVTRRTRVSWGGWSQVEATLRLIGTALADPRPFSHLALISGADYPLRSSPSLLAHLQATGQDHIDRVPFPSEAEQKPWSRLARRQVQGGERHEGRWPRIVGRLNRLLARLPDRDVTRRLKGIAPYAGGQWWVMTRDTARYALDFAKKGGSVVRLFKLAHVPDEMFFHTIASARPGAKIGRAFTFADWSEGRSGPATIDHHHIDRFERPDFQLIDGFGVGPCFFARKLPEDRDDIYERLDALRAKTMPGPGIAPLPKGIHE